MSDIHKIILREKQNKKIKVKSPKEIIFYFLNPKGEKIIKGYAFNVDIKKLDFIKKYSFYYHPFAEGGFPMFGYTLEKEFQKIGAQMGSIEDYRFTLQDFNYQEDTPTGGFTYEITKRKLPKNK